MGEKVLNFGSDYKPFEVLRALATCLEKHPKEGRDLFNAISIKITASKSAIEPDLIGLIIGLPLGKIKSSLTELQSQFKAMPQPLDVDKPVDGYISLIDALPLLAVARRIINPSEETIRSMNLISNKDWENERLLYLPPSDPETVQKIAKRAKEMPVQVRFATGILPELADADPTYRYLMAWLKDDEERHSWFDSQFYPGTKVLRVIHFNGCYIAVDEQSVLYKESIEALIRITHACPQALSADIPDKPNEGFWWILLPRISDKVTWFYLDAKEFSAGWIDTIEPSDSPPPLTPKLEIIRLHSDPAGYAEIRQNVERAGYRLHLRKSKHLQFDTLELERLEAELYYLQEEVNVLRDLQGSSPRLYRFSHTDLEALVETLTQYAPECLKQILYAFHAPTKDGLISHHYLFLRDDIPTLLGQHIDRWIRKATQPVEFWLDPRWASIYRDNNNSAVFVPIGMVLAPDFHSWEVKTMDQYLRLVAEDWFEITNGARTLPKHPLFVFEEDGTEGVQVRILDLDEFKPISDPIIVGWQNDVLNVIYHTDTVKEFIETISNQRLRQRHIAEATAELEAARTMFEQRRMDIMNQMDEASKALLSDIAHVLDQVQEEAEKLIDNGKEMNSRLNAMDRLFAKASQDTNTAQRMVNETHEEITTLEKRVETLTNSADDIIARSLANRAGIVERVAKEVSQLIKIREQITVELERLMSS